MHSQQEIQYLTNIIDELLQSSITHGLARSLRSLRKEILVYNSHIDGLKHRQHKHNKKFLQIGGGTHILENYINLDIFPPADIICDVREGIPLNDSSIKKIFTEHFFEHIDYPVSAKKFIHECYRVLEVGGEIILGVPDGNKILEGYFKKDKKLYHEMLSRWYSNRNCQDNFNTYIDLVNFHFRDQDDDIKYNPHFWTYDFEKLTSLFSSVGFKDITRWEFDPALANPKREFGSIYVRAKK